MTKSEKASYTREIYNLVLGTLSLQTLKVIIFFQTCGDFLLDKIGLDRSKDTNLLFFDNYNKEFKPSSSHKRKLTMSLSYKGSWQRCKPIINNQLGKFSVISCFTIAKS